MKHGLDVLPFRKNPTKGTSKSTHPCGRHLDCQLPLALKLGNIGTKAVGFGAEAMSRCIQGNAQMTANV